MGPVDSSSRVGSGVGADDVVVAGECVGIWVPCGSRYVRYVCHRGAIGTGTCATCERSGRRMVPPCRVDERRKSRWWWRCRMREVLSSAVAGMKNDEKGMQKDEYHAVK